jgi:ATP-dependent protease HslVU (ClpYQ) peptidase subunit
VTTIATDGKVMAADGLITGDGIVYSRSARKVFKLNDGGVVGISGSSYNASPFVEWLEKGGDKPTLPDGFEAIVVTPKGRCLSYNEYCRAIPEELPTACGSGRQLAMGAMEAGASPRKAVQIAARRDTCTGGKVTCLKVGK